MHLREVLVVVLIAHCGLSMIVGVCVGGGCSHGVGVHVGGGPFMWMVGVCVVGIHVVSEHSHGWEVVAAHGHSLSMGGASLCRVICL